jgi:hypothetical protein
VIWAILYFVLFGGGSAQALGELTTRHLEGALREHVADADRRREALAALDHLKKDIKALDEAVAKSHERYQKLVADPSTRPEELDQVFEEASRADLARVSIIWADRAAVLRHVKPVEWAAAIQAARAEAAKVADKKRGEK